MGKNSWIEREDRKRIQKEEVVDHIPEEQKGDPSSRLETSKGPAEEEEKRRVVEKLKEREGD